MTKKRSLEKKPYNIPKMFQLIRSAIEPFPKATLFQLKEEGYHRPFEQLVACLLSIRTLDEVSLVAAKTLLEKANTPQQILEIPDEQLNRMIHSCTFSFQKVSTLKKISQILTDQYQGTLPCSFEKLIELPGVGPKCANLVLGIACGEPRIGVDIHVHRVTNRWGYVLAKTPEKTLFELEKILPKEKYVEINELLVPFGKHICLGTRPRCTTCPVLNYCRQVGVERFQ